MPQLLFLHTVTVEVVGAAAGVLDAVRPPPRPLPLPEGVLRGLDLLLLFFPPEGPGAAPAAEAERDHAGRTAAIVPSWRSSASDLRRHRKRRHFFSTSVDQNAVACWLEEWTDCRKMHPPGRCGRNPGGSSQEGEPRMRCRLESPASD